MVLILIENERPSDAAWDASDLIVRREANAYRILRDKLGLDGRVVSAAELHEVIGGRLFLRNNKAKAETQHAQPAV